MRWCSARMRSCFNMGCSHPTKDGRTGEGLRLLNGDQARERVQALILALISDLAGDMIDKVADFAHRLAGSRREEDIHGEKTVDHAGMAADAHVNGSLFQLFAVILSLLGNDVVLGGNDKGGRQLIKSLGIARREVRVLAQGWVRLILIEEPGDVADGDERG